MTSVSLIGQWEDECRKHAPGLKVGRYHPSSGKYIMYKDLHELDVVVSSSTFDWRTNITDNFEFHRVVVDEAHLFASASASHYKANAKVSAVTATPCVSSVSQLTRQMSFLSGGQVFRNRHVIQSAVNQFDRLNRRSTAFRKKQAFYTLLDALKPCMIRHTKSQRIHGSAALALPASTTTAVYHDMTPKERGRFAHAHVGRFTLQNMIRGGAKTLTLEKCFTFRMKQIDQEEGAGLIKVKTLVKDLREMHRSEPDFRVVVFTQSLQMHKFVVKALRREGLNTFEFNGSTSATSRDKAIRCFQNEVDENPAVFVITLRAGNVGITLTAASRVYLMEPSLDPAAEVQAAGRIHRLGQTKQVQVKKLVFRDCVESNVVKLHKEIAAGRVSVSDGFFPPKAVKILAKNIQTKH